MTTITLNKGGQGERTVEIESVQIPDLWHIAEWIEMEAAKLRQAVAPDYAGRAERAKTLDEQAQAIKDTWHLAHDMKRHIAEW